MLPVSAIHPDPKNPRQEMGDIDGLAHELKTIGQFDAISVYQHPELDGDYMIQGGHRRHAAALRAGLTELKCEIVPSPENAALDLYTEALSTGTNHMPLDSMGQSKSLQGMLIEGKSEAWISKNFNIPKAEVKPRARLADNPRVAQIHARGTIDLLSAAAVLDVEEETGDASIFDGIVDDLEASHWKKDQMDVNRLIEQRKQNARRDKLRAELTGQDAVEIDSQNRYSGKWVKTEQVLDVAGHVQAGHQFDVSTPDSVDWWEKSKASAKAKASPEEKARRENIRRLDGVLPIAQRARHKFVIDKIRDRKGIEDRNARGLLVSMIFQEARGGEAERHAIGEAVGLPFPEPGEDQTLYSPELCEVRTRWEAEAYKAALGLSLQQLSLLLAYVPVATTDRNLGKTNWYMRDSWEKEARWAPLSRWYQQLIDFAGYVPSEDEAEMIRIGQQTRENTLNDVHLHTATCKNCNQEVVSDKHWTGICAECAPAIDGIEVA